MKPRLSGITGEGLHEEGAGLCKSPHRDVTTGADLFVCFLVWAEGSGTDRPEKYGTFKWKVKFIIPEPQNRLLWLYKFTSYSLEWALTFDPSQQPNCE